MAAAIPRGRRYLRHHPAHEENAADNATPSGNGTLVGVLARFFTLPARTAIARVPIR